jgi:Tfp pilus assembly protein PilV
MRSPLIAALVLAVSALACGGQPADSSGTITVRNQSSYILDEINVAPVSQVSWGPNLLSGVLYSGEQVTIYVACGTYDVQVWDQHNRSCILSGLDLCFSDQLWTVDNYTLRNCGY